MEARKIFEAIVYVLRTGVQWKALPKEFGSASSIHSHFLRWQAAGFFQKLWRKGLSEYDELEGILWRWQSIDGAMNKAPLAQETGGPSPTDRGEEKVAIQNGFKAKRWVVEAAHSWFNRFCKILIRFEKKTASYEAILHLAASIIIFRKLGIIYG